MRRWNLSRGALSVCVAAASLAGCGGTQPLSGVGQAPVAPARTVSHRPLAKSYFKSLFVFYGANGEYPVAGLLNVNGTLYGTTTAGGGGRTDLGMG